MVSSFVAFLWPIVLAAIGFFFFFCAFARLTLGAPSQCLISEPSSKPGVNKGLGSLFSFFVCLFQLVSFPFRSVLCKFAARLSTVQRHISVRDVSLRCISQEAPPFVGPLPTPGLIASRPGLANLAHLRFFDPCHFRAGSIHNKLSLWPDLLEKSPCSEVDLLEIIRNVVCVDRFFKPFRGNFKGQAYNSEYPPSIVIQTSPRTTKFYQFVFDFVI